jgi:hypothetical protein
MIHDPDMYYNLSRLLKTEEIEQFGKWAFTDRYEDLDSFHCMLAWNQLHGDEFELHSHDLMKDTLPMMIAIWRTKNVT